MTDTQLTDEQAQDKLVWLTSKAPGELAQFVGGAIHDPAYDERTIEYLDQIISAAQELKRYAKRNESDVPVTPDYDAAQPEELRQHRKTDAEIEKEEKAAAKAAEDQGKEAEKAAAKASGNK